MSAMKRSCLTVGAVGEGRGSLFGTGGGIEHLLGRFRFPAQATCHQSNRANYFFPLPAALGQVVEVPAKAIVLSAA